MDANIEALPFSPTKKAELQWIQDNVERVSGLTVVMKTNAPAGLLFSWAAFFFSCWTYIFKGMAKKGVLLLVLCMGVSGVGLFIMGMLSELFEWTSSTDEAVASLACWIPQLLLSIYCGKNYRYDFYRRHVKWENFWV